MEATLRLTKITVCVILKEEDDVEQGVFLKHSVLDDYTFEKVMILLC